MNINKKAFKDAENENIYTLELYKNSTTGNIEYRSPKGVIIKVADKDGLESLESAVTSLQSAVDALPAAPTTTVVNISSAQILSNGGTGIVELITGVDGKAIVLEEIFVSFVYDTQAEENNFYSSSGDNDGSMFLAWYDGEGYLLNGIIHEWLGDGVIPYMGFTNRVNIYDPNMGYDERLAFYNWLKFGWQNLTGGNMDVQIKVVYRIFDQIVK